jgi:hypothetical protein
MEPWKELLDYWQSKHVAGRPPGRRDIDPLVEIPKLAANLLLADIEPEGYRYRLFGSALVERYGEDMTGRLAGTSRFLELVSKDLLANYDLVRQQRKPRILVTGAQTSDHSGAVTMILPLISASGVTEMLMVGVFYDRHFIPIEHIDYLIAKEPGA